MSPANLGLERPFAGAPSADTERRSPFTALGQWTPAGLRLLAHEISIDIATGNVLVTATDRSRPYHSLSAGCVRTYDAQEQHMQSSHMAAYPNVDPNPHWFGNWRFSMEAGIDDVWRTSTSELHVASGAGLNALFTESPPEFRRNHRDQAQALATLMRHGVPARTLAEARYVARAGDHLLRTKRGPFLIAAGWAYEKTFTDPPAAELCVFDPISGSAFRITSDAWYDVRTAATRRVGFPFVTSRVTDALGHAIDFEREADGPMGPRFVLRDGAGRRMSFRLEAELRHADGSHPGGEVCHNLVSHLIDEAVPAAGPITFGYRAGRLERAAYPGVGGLFGHDYFYDDPRFPAALTRISDGRGEVHFAYEEDPADLDERLEPRLKLHVLTVPDGATLTYDHDYGRSTVRVTVSRAGVMDRVMEYHYVRDATGLKQRFIDTTSQSVQRGFVLDAGRQLTARPAGAPQAIRVATTYTNDGRYNVERQADALQRVRRLQYNDFNQVERAWDFAGHWTEYVYDLPALPTPANPLRFDLLRLRRESLVRNADPAAAGGFIETVATLEKTFSYDPYDAANSGYAADHGVQSTHRLATQADELGNTWFHTYDDVAGARPVKPSRTVSPLGWSTQCAYDAAGNRTLFIDAENNTHRFAYNAGGALSQYDGPNGEVVRLDYDATGRWLARFTDQAGQVTDFHRDPDGRLRQVVDPVLDVMDYEYYADGRPWKVIRHRPAVVDPRDPTAPAITAPYQDLTTELRYAPLGALTHVIDPLGAGHVYEHDEAGRVARSGLLASPLHETRFAYDAAGQVVAQARPSGITTMTYHATGELASVQYPDWNDGAGVVPGKRIDYRLYDYAGRLLSVADSEIAGTTEHMYDDSGRLVLRRDAGGFELALTHDGDGRLTHARSADGSFELVLGLDGLGRARALDDSAAVDGSATWTYRYSQPLGAGARVLNLYEISMPQIGLSQRFDYDAKGRVKLIEAVWSGNPETVAYQQRVDYGADDLIRDVRGDDGESYAYDGSKQLVFESVGALVSRYDEVGNRITRSAAAVAPNRFDAANQLRHDGAAGVDLGYDGDGNVAAIGTTPPGTLRFDGAGRMRVVESGGARASYLYDHEGRLVQRSYTTAGAAAVTHRFHYLSRRPIVIEANGALEAVLTWSPDGRLLRIRSPRFAGGAQFANSVFPLRSAQQALSRMFDDRRNAAAALRCDAWGRLSRFDGDPQLAAFHGFRGGLHDVASGFILFGSRWYWPAAGRWISMDPISHACQDASAFGDLQNLYAYAGNNPINIGDPSGLSAEGDLQAAIAWVRENYPELFPASGVKIDLGDPGRGNWGATYPLGGDIVIDPNQSLEMMVDTVAHELMHLKMMPTASERVAFNYREFFGSETAKREHNFASKAGTAIKTHFQLSRQGPVTPQMLEQQYYGRVVFDSIGQPMVVWSGPMAQTWAGMF